MTFIDYKIYRKLVAARLSKVFRSFSNKRPLHFRRSLVAVVFGILTAAQANATPPPDFALTCTSSGASAHIQSIDKSYEVNHKDLAGEILTISAHVVTKPGMKLFAPKPNLPVYTMDVLLGAERLFRIAGQTYDETGLSAYGERIAFVDMLGSGSSVMLLADGSGGWKGRAISTEGFLDRRASDVTLYIALTCRRAGD